MWVVAEFFLLSDIFYNKFGKLLGQPKIIKKFHWVRSQFVIASVAEALPPYP
jgi:hypothetical protein